MTILLITHESSFEHVTPAGHPERPDRVTAVVRGARSAAVPILEMRAPMVSLEVLEMVHGSAYIRGIKDFCAAGGGAFDADTHAVSGSFRAALHAAGAGPAAVKALEEGVADAAFVAMRPPGHHAESRRAMGFCLFNNVAVVSAYLRSRGERVAVVDWDVHHGNGTQAMFYRDPEVLYISLHESPFYPGTGGREEQGEGPGEGFTVNVPILEQTSADAYLELFARIVVPVLEQFDPGWIVVSNGYDAHRLDPLGGLLLESRHFGWMARALSDQVPRGRVIAMLEGGYDLTALAESATATVDGLGGACVEARWPDGAVSAESYCMESTVSVLSAHWELR